MKKVLTISGTIYVGICIGMCIYMIVDPEGYGKLLGRMYSGVTKGMND